MEDKYRQIAQFESIFQSFVTGRDVHRDAAGSGTDDVETAYAIPKRINSAIREILWEEDALGFDIRNHVQKESLDDVASAEPLDDPVVPKPISESGSSSLSDKSESSTEEEPEVHVEFYTDDGVENNFAQFTYWNVESGPRVSYTLKPLYSKSNAKAVTLLEDAEAFVATAIWGGPDAHKIHQAPRHLLVQAAQVASRAFFDPDYRDYLQTSHIS
ncbi:hypothetical protein, conserved [Babesia ovata]|uniref:Uncharacterized protein n=1 Tax=Babesia ovata TaxID=189622 RepID=A0A2H6KHW4_9APIC|nr:uncharacterized protein BOVATA_040660 [Babesia ovata]GBE62573.1 hypothetical protein, conserved [Babesia ovata]